MIAPNTKLLVLDIESGDPISDTVENIYQKYSHLSTMAIAPFEKRTMIEFKNMNINMKVTDWTGWTDLHALYKYQANVDWYDITTEEGGHIKMSSRPIDDDTIIPVYEPEMRKRGFHGEVLYKFNPLRVEDIVTDGWLRERDISGDNGVIKQFSRFHIEKSSQEDYGYSLITRSKFFNANNIHLCTRGILISEKFSSVKEYYK